MAITRGFRSKRKLLVIESDDWGSISIPDSYTLHRLKSAGIEVGNDNYCLYDNLASREDLELLFELLSGFKDIHNRAAVVTANVVMANPDFRKIKDGDFQQYFYKNLVETLKEYEVSEGAWNNWKEGINRGYFFPQLHSREHLNVPLWLKELREGNPEYNIAFKYNTFSIPVKKKLGNRFDCRAALEFVENEHLNFQKKMIKEGAELFREIFGYTSKSFIAPCYVWSSIHENWLAEEGVKILQGNYVQRIPQGNYRAYGKKYNFTGRINERGIYYQIRNVFLEPSYPGDDVYNKCLRDIDLAFACGKPAIVCCHRKNFIGSHSVKNRDFTLNTLKKLLTIITKKYPDVEFKTSAEMHEIYEDKD